MKPSANLLINALLGALFIAFFAQIAFDIPWADTSIPVSGQTFAVLVTAMLLGKWGGALSVLIYLLAGGLGLPVFADGGAGWETFQTGSGGYLCGFVLAAYVVGWLGEQRQNKKNLLMCILIMLIGTLLIMACGVAFICHLNGGDFQAAMSGGFYPFIPGAIVKIVLGALVVWLVG